MPYNQKTAFENQKKYLQSQMHCGYPNIERAACKNYNRLLEEEKKQFVKNEKNRKAVAAVNCKK